MKATWNHQIIAESNDTVVIENNHYFPAESLKKEFFIKSDTSSHCPWKGEASYYSIEVNDKTNTDAAWYYPKTSHAAKSIEGHIAFWKGVEISE